VSPQAVATLLNPAATAVRDTVHMQRLLGWYLMGVHIEYSTFLLVTLRKELTGIPRLLTYRWHYSGTLPDLSSKVFNKVSFACDAVM
jgi:hypothetical protein